MVLMKALFVHLQSRLLLQKSCATWQPQLLLQWDGTITSHSPRWKCPWKQQGTRKKNDLRQVAFVVRAELLRRLRCRSKQHKMTLVKIGTSECKICYSYIKKISLWSLWQLRSSAPTTLPLTPDFKGVCDCRHNYFKWKDSLKFKEDHQI